MCHIAESNVLLRAQVALPIGFKVATEEFREGWNLMRAGGTRRLEKKTRTRGWSFIKIADGSPRSGVGETSQQAIASALRLALLRVDQRSNAVEVERIELTRYPWFFLAKVSVHPYRIQPGIALPALDEEGEVPSAARQNRRSLRPAELFPQFGCEMPVLKEMLLSSRGLAARTQ